MRIVDLSITLKPTDAARKLRLRRIQVESFNPDVRELAGQWYIAHEVEFTSHIGTHIETPYHINPAGSDLATLPLDTLCGEAVLLDLPGLDDEQPIGPELLMEAEARAGGIHPGDMVLVNIHYARFYGTAKYDRSPFFTIDAITFLKNRGIKFLGVDANGAEVPHDDSHPNHHALLDAGIPIIENVANLDSLQRKRFHLFAFPVAIEGLESFPIRLVAIEDILSNS
ncbi:MAG: cyclase family protein [Planctomycetes bacterium]|nr:cyclase family protein [Planctomycetota bacterium]